jgi:inosine triphosphate pyrophosphatase
MAYAMISSYGKANRAISAASAVLRGFNSVYPLTIGERNYLRLLISSRLSCSATLGAYSYQQNPQNEYLLLHAEPAWKTLELLWGSENSDMADAIDNMFRIACDGCANDCSDISFPDPSIPDALKSARLDNGAEGPPPLKKQKVTIADTNVADKPIITFVTGNKKKLEEVKRILASPKSDGDAKQDESLPFTIANKKLDLPELQGDPLEIAKEKCALAAKELGGAVITEDTSLCFIALNSMPGPYIKWFLDKCGLDGLNSMIDFSQDKSGYAQTVVGFCAGPGNEVIVFDGRTMGTIVPPRGSLDFGWDPIFQPDEGNGLTYAEMSKDAKDSISHRSRAFNKLRLYLENETDAIKESISFLAN